MLPSFPIYPLISRYSSSLNPHPILQSGSEGQAPSSRYSFAIARGQRVSLVYHSGPLTIFGGLSEMRLSCLLFRLVITRPRKIWRPN